MDGYLGNIKIKIGKGLTSVKQGASHWSGFVESFLFVCFGFFFLCQSEKSSSWANIHHKKQASVDLL